MAESTRKKRWVITGRDIEIIRALYEARMLTAEQLARLQFPSVGAARQKLYRSRDKGFVESHRYIKPQNEKVGTVWTLTQETFSKESEERYNNERYPGLPTPTKLVHDLGVNDLYAAVGVALDVRLGPNGWSWLYERRASKSYEYMGARRTYQPDAELTMPGHGRFAIEYQAADISMSALKEKAERYRVYTSYTSSDPAPLRVVFISDVGRILKNASQAFAQARVSCFTGSLEEAEDMIVHEAEKAIGLHQDGVS